MLTVGYFGWNGLKNGELLVDAESDGFEVVVTGDRMLRYRQNLQARKIALVILTVIRFRYIEDHLALIVKAIEDSVAGSFREIKCDDHRPGG